MKYTILLIAIAIVFLTIPIHFSEPGFNGTNPGCDGSGCHTLQDGIVSASVTDLNVSITVSGTTSSVGGELVNANGTVVAFNNSTGNNPFTLTAPGPGIYKVNAGFKNPSPRRWDSVMVNIGIATTFQLSINIANGWNMVSIPGLHPTDQNVSTWWVFRDPAANVFRYAGGYQSVAIVTPGTGYWMKHNGARTYNTGDEWPAGGINIVPHTPLNGATGWNLIGGYENIATASLVTTNPPGQQSGPIYKYAGGYQIATTLDPGYGYWMKLTGAGQIIIPETLAKDGKPVEYFPEDWGKIVLTDATGINYTLYAVKGQVDLNQYELPPAPPAGMFDIRFSSGRIAEDINSSVKFIDVSGVTYPLAVRVEGIDIRLMDESGKMLNMNLKSGENVVLENNTINKLMVSGELLPTVYSLEQNYPNPFNPSTMIGYQLPVTGYVTLKVFDVLGNEIATLVDEHKSAGKYKVEFEALGLSSGIYFYRLQAGSFSEIKKMILIK